MATLLLVGFVGVIEIAQLVVPGRHARLSDFLIDAFAVSIGLAGAHFGLPHNSDDSHERALERSPVARSQDKGNPRLACQRGARKTTS